jgi:hypothetical protein
MNNVNKKINNYEWLQKIIEEVNKQINKIS